MADVKTGKEPLGQEASTDTTRIFRHIETKWLVLLAIGVGTFMSALDGSIVNVILPVITDYFNTSVATIEWVVTVYLLVVSGLLLSVGRLGDLRGNKRIYITGFFIFVTGSVLAGFSPSAVYLIGARGIQAIGSAMLFANAPAILTKIFPASQRGQALGLQGTMTYLGLTVGPFLGGWLTDHLSWHFVFFVNVPVGLFAIWLSLMVIPKDSRSVHDEPFDVIGAITFMTGLTALLFALNKAESWGWTSLPILGLIVASLLILSLFIWIELHIKTPMLDLSLFKRKVFAISAISPCLKLYVYLQRALLDAVLSDPWPRSERILCRPDFNHSTDCHGIDGTIEWKSLRSGGVTPADHFRHVDLCSRFIPAWQLNFTNAPRYYRDWPWNLRTWRRPVCFPEQQFVDG